MCNNIIVLYLFILLKICALLILPIVIFIKREKKYAKILLIVDIVLVLFFIICNRYTINKCVYNSNIEGIKKTKTENTITLSNKLHPTKQGYTSNGIKAEKKYKTYLGKNLYYYNINKDSMKDSYIYCNNKKIYFNSFGSSLAAYSTAVSTLYNKEINPIELLDLYKQSAFDACNSKIEIENINSVLKDKYSTINIQKIYSYQINQALKEGNLVIVKLNASENSKLTCDTDYIVIYSMSSNNKFKIAVPSLKDKSYVCSYSSKAYGNTIKNTIMDKDWTLEEINNDAESYYLIKRG